MLLNEHRHVFAKQLSISVLLCSIVVAMALCNVWCFTPYEGHWPEMRSVTNCYMYVVCAAHAVPTSVSRKSVTKPLKKVNAFMWAQVEWWLEHRHGWLVKPQWAGSVLGRVTRYEYQVLGSTSIPARLDTLVYWEPFSWLTSVGTTRNTVIRLGWSRIGLAVLNLHAAGVGLIGRPAVISGRYNKCYSLQLQNHYAHFPPLHHTHIHAKHNLAEPVMGNGYGFRGIVCWPWQEKSCVIG